MPYQCLSRVSAIKTLCLSLPLSLLLAGCGNLGDPAPPAAEAVGEEVDDFVQKISPEKEVPGTVPAQTITPAEQESQAASAGGLLGVPAAAATESIDRWIESLRGHPNVDDSENIVEDLIALKVLLAAPTIDAEAVSERLRSLAEETHDAARDNADDAAVEKISQLLSAAADQLEE